MNATTTTETTTGLSDAHTAQPSLSGRRAIITGGTTGIGRAIAVLLASEGARVFICGRDAQHLEDALARIGEVGDGGGIAVDLAERQGVEQFFEAAHEHLGGAADIAVINAAIPADGLGDVDADELDYQVAVDFTSYVRTAHRAAEAMESGGDILFIGSTSALSQSGESTIYIGAKAGIEAFARALGKELGERNIKVGIIEPGYTGADFHGEEMPPEKQREQIHASKMLRAEDIAAAAHFMLTQPPRTVVTLMRVEPLLE